MHDSVKTLLTSLFLASTGISFDALAADCEGPTNSDVVAIPFDFHVVQNAGRWVTFSATSPDIEFNSLNQGWPKRYKAFRYGGEAAITSWIIDTAPSNGTLYEKTTALSAGDTVEDPDDLFYEPNDGFAGNDVVKYCAEGESGKSATADLILIVSRASEYPMPIGIPNPGFGIDEQPPADPGAWPGSEVSGYYYIDSDHPNCSNSNTYGYPNEPRCSIPNNATIEAGRKMVLANSSQPYPLRNGGFHQLRFNGTAAQTAWLVGDEKGPNKPHITMGGGDNLQDLRIAGTGNYRISGIDLDGPNLRNQGGAQNIVVRYSVMRNYASTNGGGTTVSVSGSDAENILFLHVNAHDNGRISQSLAEERDIHAFVGSRQKNWWLLDILCSENAGDCVQLTNNNTTENVYVGRATMHSMMENCIDFKDFNKFVVSESHCWDIRRVSYSGGSGGLAQNFYTNDEGNQTGYGYFLNNRSWDTGGQNYSASNVGGRVYFIGNLAFFSPEGTGLASGPQGGDRHYYFNTIINVRDGMDLFTAGSGSDRYVAGNYIHSVTRYATSLDGSTSGVDSLDYNAYGSGMNFSWGSSGDFNRFKSSTRYDDHSIENVDAGFINLAKLDIRLRESSDLIDLIPANVLQNVAPGMEDLRNDLSILNFEDRFGSKKPVGSYDAGATEFDSGMSPPIPPKISVQ